MKLAQSNVPSIGVLAGNVIKDSEKLVRQEFSLLEARLDRHIDQKLKSLARTAVGLFLCSLTIVLIAMMAVNLLTSEAGVPLWASYGLTGLLSLVGAVGFFVMRGDYDRQRTET